MIFLVIQYLFLTTIFFTLFCIGLIEKRKKAIVPVKDLRHMCNTDIERKMYDRLIQKGIYVSPSIRLGICSIPIALAQYKIAIFSKPKRKTAFVKRLFLILKDLYLRSIGWKVLIFSHERLQTDFDNVIERILTVEAEGRFTQEPKKA